MYNKNRFRKLNEKKVLHKIGKRWIVMSISLLGALGIGGLINRSVHASVPSAPSSASVQGLSVSNHASLTASQPSSAASSVNSTNPQSSNKSLNSQVRTLYQQIISNAQRNISLHQTNPVNGDPAQNTQLKSGSVNPQIVRGQWGTAPFSFDPKSGLLQTTDGGVITPIEQLGQSNDQFKLQDIKDIRFAPGTQAPVSTKLSDGSLFGVQLDPVQTTDGPSDSTAYVSELCNLSDIDCTNLDTSDMTNMGGMFKNDTGLKSIQFGPHFNTHNVTEMSVMFYNDINLQSLDLSHFDTSNVLGMTSMFQSDYALSDLNLGPHFNTDKVAYMSDVFHSDNSLQNLDLGNQFYISNGYNNDPINLSDMFMNDYQLHSLNLGPHFNTMQVNNMSDMFANDSDLTSLDLGNQFYTGQVPDMHNMFKGDTDLQSLNLGPYFDTLKASETNFNNSNTDNGETVSNAYNGAQDVFAGDDSLNHLIMNGTRLAGPVNLPHDALATWRQRQDGQPVNDNVNLTDGNLYSGDYGRYAVRPVQKTCLELVDSNGQSIGDVFVSGLAGTNVPFATISNVLGDGYRPIITTHDIITTFPNSPYKYVAGVVKVNVTKDGDSSHNGNSAPVSAAAPQSAVNSYAASVADQEIESSEMKSVASSVAIANADKARAAAQLADERIMASLKKSVANSVAVANQAKAKDAAHSADQRIASSLSNSVTASVSVANQSRADRAARLADQRIVTSFSNSVLASVSSANQSTANQAASVADVSLEDSVVSSYAQSADQRIANSTKASVSMSVAKANQSKAERAAQVADQRIQSSIATSAASSADARIVASERASVSNSVSVVNASVTRSAAYVADQKINESLRDSVTASVSVMDQRDAEQAALNTDQQLESSYAESGARSADQRIDSSIAASYAKAADNRIESSLRASILNSLSSVNDQINQVNNSLRNSKPSQSSSAAKSLELSPLSSHINLASASSSSIEAKIVDPQDNMTLSNDSSQSQSQSVIPASVGPDSSSIDPRSSVSGHPVERRAVRDVHADGTKITQVPVRCRYFEVLRTCLAHNHIGSVGMVKDYSAVLHRHAVIRIEKVFRIRRGRRVMYRYEIMLKHHRYFMTANRIFIKGIRHYWYKMNRRRYKFINFRH